MSLFNPNSGNSAEDQMTKAMTCVVIVLLAGIAVLGTVLFLIARLVLGG